MKHHFIDEYSLCDLCGQVVFREVHGWYGDMPEYLLPDRCPGANLSVAWSRSEIGAAFDRRAEDRLRRQHRVSIERQWDYTPDD